MSEPKNVTTNFDAAIGMFSDHAHDAFIAAWGALSDPDIPKDTAEGQLVAALAQLSAASSMKLQQRSQAGFDAVVDLMRTTAKAADDVRKILIPLLQRDSGHLGDPEYRLIDELKSTLDVLARLSPSAVWASAGGSASSE
jgi:hypothetical protein